MRISELQEILQSYKDKFGDLDILMQSTDNDDEFEPHKNNFCYTTEDESDKRYLTILV
jgi:hypothetical protein